MGCVDKLYHPNIDLEGKVCVNILRPWKPTYSIQSVLFGLIYLFSNPNADDPLNSGPLFFSLNCVEAAADMRNDRDTFGANVLNALRGKRVNDIRFNVNRARRFGGDGHPAFDAKAARK